jgi:hypothetical protein
VRDSAAIHVKDAKDWAALAERGGSGEGVESGGGERLSVSLYSWRCRRPYLEDRPPRG